MKRNKGEQQDLPRLAIGQANEWHTNHERVAEDTGQGQHRCAGISSVQQEHDEKKSAGYQEVLEDRLQIQFFKMNRTHGSEQQSLRQNQKNQIGQVANGFLSDQFGPARNKANQDQKDNG